jgi:predicted RNA-binding protein YlqC (UPF0109 family)
MASRPTHPTMASRLLTHTYSAATLASNETTNMTPGPQFEKLLTDLLRDIVTEFIFHPDDLQITCRRFHQIVSIQWRGHRADTSRMIGEGAQTYHQLKQLLRLIGEQHGYDADLARVGEPTTGQPERYPGFAARADWPRSRLLYILKRATLAATYHQKYFIQDAPIADDTTAIVIKIDRRETLRTETVLCDSLKHLAKAMFSANGRLVKLQVERSLEAEI